MVGEVNQYRGAVQIFAPRVRVLGTAALPSAEPVSVEEAASWERYGERVRIEGVLGKAETGSFATVPLRSGGGGITLFLPEKVARTFPFDLFPAGAKVAATGVVSIYDEAWPYDAGFQLVVSSQSAMQPWRRAEPFCRPVGR